MLGFFDFEFKMDDIKAASININYGDLSQSSDKYLITEQHINSLYFAISFDL